MTDFDDLPFSEPQTGANAGAAGSRKCRHPREARVVVHFVTNYDPTRELWHVDQPHAGYESPCEPGIICLRCYKRLDAAVSRRGRNNRRRGNSIEREVGRTLGLRRVGQFGGPIDLGESADPFVVQVKSGSMFSEKYWDHLKRQPVAASQTALLVVTTAPGPGVRRRAMVVLDLADWVLLHGPSGVETT